MLFDYPTLEGFAGYVVRDVLHLECQEEPSGPKAEAAIDEVRQQALADVEVMSEEEMDALVKMQLEKLDQ